MSKQHTGLRRLGKAVIYSCQGLIYAFRYEAAFRQEAIAACFLIPITFWLDVSPVERSLLLMTVFLVLIVELLNTAVEAAIDRIGPEHHALAGVAKDAGSAAVFVALILLILIWGTILIV